MEATNRYSAQVVNVSNNFRAEKSFLSIAIALAQGVDEVVMVLGHNEEVVYFNNRFGSFDNAMSKDTKTWDSACRFLAGSGVYKDIHILCQVVKNVYLDLMPASATVQLTSGELVRFKVIPAIENYNVTGVVMIGIKINDRRTEIRSGESKRIQQRAGSWWF